MAPVGRSQLYGQSLCYDEGKTISEMRARWGAQAVLIKYMVYYSVFSN